VEIEIRRATIQDIDAIAEIIKLVFDDIVDTERVRQLLTLSHNYIYVAMQSDVVVGFVENFVTISQDKQIRLELDLLAVHPDARGQGIGKKLIEVSIDLAKQLNVFCLRALIATENGVMQQACKRMNLTPSHNEFGLYVGALQQVLYPIKETPNAHLIQVETLTYKVVWLEGDITALALDNAYLIATENQYDILGAVVDKVNNQTVELLTDRQFTFINDNRRWVLILKSD